MDGKHPKNKGTHPRRAKAKDNPYTIYTTGSDTGHPKYILEFTDGQKRPQRLEIDRVPTSCLTNLNWRTSAF